jgi:hypothetical protein
MPFSARTVERPASSGPVKGIIPADLAEFLTIEAAKALESGMDLELEHDSEKEAKRYASLAGAWGGRQDPKLVIHRLSPRPGQPANVVRMRVKEHDDSAPKRGRPAQRAA